MSIFYISDLHFGHENVIKFDERPFKDTEEMAYKMIEKWNSVVNESDEVYILGDIGLTADFKKVVSIFSRLKGIKHLVIGNHDKKLIKKYPEWFELTFADIDDYMEVIDNGRRVILCHYPILFYNQSYREHHYMLHGHVHIKNEAIQCLDMVKQLQDNFKKVGPDAHANRGQIYNVGCMTPHIDYTPRTLDQIIKGH